MQWRRSASEILKLCRRRISCLECAELKYEQFIQGLKLGLRSCQRSQLAILNVQERLSRPQQSLESSVTANNDPGYNEGVPIKHGQTSYSGVVLEDKPLLFSFVLGIVSLLNCRFGASLRPYPTKYYAIISPPLSHHYYNTHNAALQPPRPDAGATAGHYDNIAASCKGIATSICTILLGSAKKQAASTPTRCSLSKLLKVRNSK
ncbi:uncharacterized protein BDR25DRAFT_362721 [Lindgomyces ingoldianus]|uniref:Uncharacterized protein n=1 Tax=Lindgomyces ingoldianus TaxID=673940 RepID=A0ACB6QAE4_9PLEO|nr:uncharacterized protein BDR25DRAFT_362721 [Lindgomyces ingoldianus]KAF2463553.1 hypothetical protein BDR25DRAFT_362721 [Lindgomyces ingoldianus]